MIGSRIMCFSFLHLRLRLHLRMTHQNRNGGLSFGFYGSFPFLPSPRSHLSFAKRSITHSLPACLNN
ncbi:hypothetical protein O6H91_22G003500 [Diphasiastrum complanatum]|uniref:Uncharacterized protein n=1 Tax=Diphasiastrum complanatum TaxID=34168 RepID=A0ACC2AC93_DIPCM|nr:hypothetical protein O6H91_22G003500 [Diphasiastrum complanatum]